MISLRKTGGLALPVNQQGPGLSGGKQGKWRKKENLCAEINCRDNRKLYNWEAEEGLLWVYTTRKTKEEGSAEVNGLWAQELDAIM